MQLRKIGFERVSNLIVVSAIGKNTSSLEALYIKSQGLSLSFEDYVKSQVHLSLVEDIYNRNKLLYTNTLNYLYKNTSNTKALFQVLRWFYSDMGFFLINNTNNVLLNVKVELESILPTVDIEYGRIKRELMQLLNSVEESNFYDLMKDYKYSFIFDYVEDLDDVFNKIDSYCMAAILLNYSNQEQLVNLEVVNLEE